MEVCLVACWMFYAGLLVVLSEVLRLVCVVVLSEFAQVLLFVLLLTRHVFALFCDE